MAPYQLVARGFAAQILTYPTRLQIFEQKTEGLLAVHRGLKTLKITDRINSRLTSPMKVIL